MRRWLLGIAKVDTELDMLRDRQDYRALMSRIEDELATSR